MNESEIPPLLDEPAALPTRPKWRWALQLIILGGYVLAVGLAGAFIRPSGEEGSGSAMPGDLGSLAYMCLVELGLFGLIFTLAWLFAQPRADELFLRWRGGLRPILWGIAYSIGLRLLIMIVMIAIMVPVVALKGKDSVENLRPKTEAIVNTPALKDPLYLIFTMTVISFGMAGFREELWRAAMLAGFAGLAPAVFSSRKGQYLAVAIAAVIFGLGHLPQGAGGVLITAALGIGLGWIIVRHQSIWEAMLAHGFFDATTFAALYFVAKYFPEALRGLAASA